MDIGRLKEFVFLADTLNFSETAKHFFMSQSVLSKHIAAMEDELNAKLFIRDSHHVRLTEQGRSFSEDAQRIIRAYDNALSRIAAINSSYKSLVTIGYLRGAAQPYVSMFMSMMAREHPDTRLALRCMEYGELYYAYSTEAVDMAFGMDMGLFHEKEHAFLPMFSDNLVCVVSDQHPLAEFEALSSEQLRGQRVLLPDEETYPGLYDFIKTFLPDGKIDEEKSTYGLYRDVDTMFLKVVGVGYVGFTSTHNKKYFTD